MEKRIKMLYAITIVSLVLLIIIQGYWLVSQYDYALQKYEDELYDKTKKAFDADLNLRNSIRTKKTTAYFILSRYYLNIGKMKCSSRWVIDIMANHGKPFTKQDSVKSMYWNSQTLSQRNIKRYTFSVNTVSSEFNINEAENMFITNNSCPFTVARFDSILKREQLSAHLVNIEKAKELIWTSRRINHSSLLQPTFQITIPFDILSHLQVRVVYEMKMLPVMGKMVGVLIFSFFFIFLLVFCLVYQLCTIRRQQRVDELRRSFIQTMVHELKRPISTLKMSISFMKNEKMVQDKQMKDDILNSAQHEVDNLSSYFSKLRDLTYGDLEEVPLNLSSFDLKKTVKECISQLNLPSNRIIHITDEYDSDSLPIKADRMHIANIISNLLENAVKYSEGETTIHISCSRKESNYLIEISDNGIGMSEEDCKHVFDKFYRSKDITEKEIPGIGLGLNYVLMLVKAHHGSITLTSQLGKGSTFAIIIPQQQ